MARNDSRYWWLERGKPGWAWWAWEYHYHPHQDCALFHPTRREVALWRLGRWQRIRLDRLTGVDSMDGE